MCYGFSAAGDCTPGTAGGYLKQITGPAAPEAPVYSFTYDTFGRIGSLTDSSGETVAYSYDAADRLTKAAFPDGTSLSLGYTLLDLTSVTDRLGNQAQKIFDAERELKQIDEPGGRVPLPNYWQSGVIKNIVDPNNFQTTFALDNQGRISQVTASNYHSPTGLQFAQHRAYDAQLARWLTRDPIGIRQVGGPRFRATDLNLYLYCGNNPTSCSDPSGYGPNFWETWAATGACGARLGKVLKIKELEKAANLTALLALFADLFAEELSPWQQLPPSGGIGSSAGGDCCGSGSGEPAPPDEPAPPGKPAPWSR
jgi:RHS repeat-associated protein